MTDSGLGLFGDQAQDPAPPPAGPGRRRAPKKQRNVKPLRWVIVLAVVGALVFGSVWAWKKADSFLNGPEDYAGEGSGEVVVEVKQGDTGSDVATTLFEAGVVKSREAFYQLSISDDRGSQLQPGFYQLRKQMSAEWALKELVDPKNRVEGKVGIPEGARVGQIVEAIAKNTEIKQEDLEAALEDPSSIGLPEEANGNPEGWLFPATYTVPPGTSATDLLSQMVKKTIAVEEDLDIDTRAKELGFSKEEIVIIASILEYEVNRDEDFGKAARVIYNRLEKDMPLQMDSTVAYVSGREGDVFTTAEERDADSEYNTYKYPGLPPGPIGSPGEATLEAALNPTPGDWEYFVADPENGGTVFTETYAEHLREVDRLQQFCRESDKC
ncbi:endolytic transglycosylase MltG [Aeromicrobium massiliense]|uniref:endolytic transglycosylase MltG n=1 Tax=Aeromicrobium massiliense TaxID=1464554 RepID=UPI0002D51DD7|nr:endolytic transglycosylase MltG [Aeromicrobium massiliense]